MAKPSTVWVFALTYLFYPSPVSICQSQSRWEIPFKVEDGWILVEADVGKMKGLTFQIDTGSTSSMIDRKISRKLGLQAGSQEYRLDALGQNDTAKKVELTGLHLGLISTSLRCLEADLSAFGVDGLIGLDVLRHMKNVIDIETSEAPARKTLTIDFTTGKVQFGQSLELDHVVPLDLDAQIVVVAGIEGHRLRMALDTGTKISVLFGGSQQRWINGLPIIGYLSGTRLLRGYLQQEVRLRNFMLGTVKCNDMSALVSDARNQPVDGLLSIIQLGPKTIHFDFDRNTMTWK